MWEGKGGKDVPVSFAQSGFYWNSAIHFAELQFFCNTTHGSHLPEKPHPTPNAGYFQFPSDLERRT